MVTLAAYTLPSAVPVVASVVVLSVETTQPNFAASATVTTFVWVEFAKSAKPDFAVVTGVVPAA